MQTNFIALEHQVVTKDEIFIASGSTVFCSERRSKLNPDRVLELYKDVVKAAKARGVKVVYKRKIKSKIVGLLSTARAALVLHNSVFDELYAGWQKKIEKGIPYGCVDDPDLKPLYSLHHQLARERYHSEPLGQLADIQGELSDFQSRIASFSPDSQATIYL